MDSGKLLKVQTFINNYWGRGLPSVPLGEPEGGGNGKR